MVDIVTQGSEARLLQEGVHAIATITYEDYPMENDQLFTMESSEKAYEIDVALSGTGLAAWKPEGTAIGYDAEKQDFVATYEHKVYALGTIITMEAQMNNKYRDLVERAGSCLKRSLVHTDEQLGADVINNAYTNTGGDGVSLADASHPLGKGGTFSNMFSSFTALSQAAIEDAFIAVEDFRDGANLLIDARVESLHIPRQLRFVADRILKSRFEPNSANVATVNPVFDIFPSGYHVNHRFTSGTDWFMKTNVDCGLTIFDRMDYTFEQDNDFGTSNFRSKGMFYKSYGYTDPRTGFFSNT
jgi:hypothetical protein|tara:strand:- start:3251 stop:4153 length:903 start_codon:yes stop_codon:yes gene_type:complete